jgi:hypothetical protein
VRPKRALWHRARRVSALRWTEEQDDVLREVSYLGAAAASEAIRWRCGVRHSVRAVEMRASRIHCSLAVRTVCPGCGAVGVGLNRQTGMCRMCTETFHLEQERAFNAQLEAERAAAEDGDAVAAVRRERDRLRQRNSRLCRKYGFAGRRGRDLGPKGSDNE